MPTATAFSLGLTSGSSRAFEIGLPTIERQAIEVEAVSVIRGLGRLLTDGDQVLVGISHQLGILPGDLAGNEDDIVSDGGFDLWWVHGLSETDHVQDRLDRPVMLAGPQTVIFVNSSGATTSIRVDIKYRLVPMPNITRWTQLKTLTSYERD